MVFPDLSLTLASSLVCLLAMAAIMRSDEEEVKSSAGYPIGNFGIAGQVGGNGAFLYRSLGNPCEEGPWLEEVFEGCLKVSDGKVALATHDFVDVESRRFFPFAELTLKDARLAGLETHIQAFSPVAAADAFTSSLPVILAEITLRNTTKKVLEIKLELTLKSLGGKRFGPDGVGQVSAVLLDGDEGKSEKSADSFCTSCAVKLDAGGMRRVRLVTALYDPDGYYTDRITGVEEMVRYTSENWIALRCATDNFSSRLPSTGDDTLNSYLRWYISAGVFLTRITKDFVITMGYCELNQRDSFWTSPPHLIYWPELERRMLQETAAHTRADGKVPTTILPIIEREDDLDINCYFLIRLWRYYSWTRDRELLEEVWPAALSALEWLHSRDTDGDGMLEQFSYWGDWKDVSGVEGRKNAPHFEFTWLAALDAMEKIATLLGKSDQAVRWREVFDKSSRAVHSQIMDGGLWNRSFYTSRWYDKREDNHVQQDQLVGAMFGQMAPDRLRLVLDALKPADAPWGVRETYPYREGFSHEGGIYHNGGVWPYLCFMDAQARYQAGYPEEAESILRRVGLWDLEKFGDYTPHEYMDGESGINRGPVIQGWNAYMLGTILWGALGVEVLDRNSVKIAPVLTAEKFETCLPLPWGDVTLRKNGQGKFQLKSMLNEDLKVSFGLWSSGAGSKEGEILGSGQIRWVQVILAAGESLEII